MTNDIARTPILKDAPWLFQDAKRIVEFYCFSHNVHYCQGMLEVLLPFLFMKQSEDRSLQPEPEDNPPSQGDPSKSISNASLSAAMLQSKSTSNL